jgi:hypothetical protein
LVFAILGVSFRLLTARRLLPGNGLGKQAVTAVVVLALAGCGGGGGAKPQSVGGDGYRFEAPAGWKVTRAAPVVSAAKGDELVSVTVFPLAKPFRAELWEQAIPELDRVAGQLATELRGRVASSETSTLAGRRARSYEIEYTSKGAPLVERIGFVLVGKREYQLLCRYAGDDDACAAFMRSFTLL